MLNENEFDGDLGLDFDENAVAVELDLDLIWAKRLQTTSHQTTPRSYSPISMRSDCRYCAVEERLNWLT